MFKPRIPTEKEHLDAVETVILCLDRMTFQEGLAELRIAEVAIYSDDSSILTKTARNLVIPIHWMTKGEALHVLQQARSYLLSSHTIDYKNCSYRSMGNSFAEGEAA